MGASKVLIVDDNADNRALAKAALEDEGLAVALATTGQEALAAFHRERPDCILMDIRMPGMDGVTVCEAIRAMPEGMRVAIIFVTAHRNIESFDRAQQAGGDDFMTKPFRPGELILRIQTAMRLRRIATEHLQLSAELRQQRDELLRLQLRKEQLAAFLIHDLRNPVNAIELQAQRILRNPEVDGRSRQAAAMIHDESRNLVRMLTNLLDISRADEGELAPAAQPLDPQALVTRVLEEMQPRARAAELELLAMVEATAIYGDSDLLYRVLVNLVDNAIRHAPSGTAIKIHVRSVANACELRVADAGAGVPEKERSKVFERFVSSADPATNRGLGLSFCKVAVELHGGRIWIEDASPGAVFCIRLPDGS